MPPIGESGSASGGGGKGRRARTGARVGGIQALLFSTLSTDHTDVLTSKATRVLLTHSLYLVLTSATTT